MGENVDAINAAVLPLVGAVCSREQEAGRVIGGRLGVVLRRIGGGEDELEGTSRVLWFDRARDGKVGANEHLKPLLLGLGDPVSGGRGGDGRVSEQIC